MKLILTKHPVSVTLTVPSPEEAYEIACRYCRCVNPQTDRGETYPLWSLEDIQKSKGSVELYLLFPIVPRRTKFLKEIAKAGIRHEIYINPDGA